MPIVYSTNPNYNQIVSDARAANPNRVASSTITNVPPRNSREENRRSKAPRIAYTTDPNYDQIIAEGRRATYASAQLPAYDSWNPTPRPSDPRPSESAIPNVPRPQIAYTSDPNYDQIVSNARAANMPSTPSIDQPPPYNSVAGGPASTAPTNPSNQILKLYKVVNPATFGSSFFEIQDEAMTPVFYNHVRKEVFRSPVLTLSRSAADLGPPLAVAKLQHLSRSFNYLVGPNHGNLEPEQWPAAVHNGIALNDFTFYVDRAPYTWKKTHNAELGGRSVATRAFKLVEGDSRVSQGRVLMTFVETRSLFGARHAVADISFYAPLAEELELSALIVMLTIEEELRRARKKGARRRNGAAGAGGAGGFAGGF